MSVLLCLKLSETTRLSTREASSDDDGMFATADAGENPYSRKKFHF